MPSSSETAQRRSVSLVIPCYNEEKVLPHLRTELTALLDRLATRYVPEVVLVDDGSRDDTWRLIREYAAADPRIKGVSLSRNFGHQAALSCGYDWAGGDATIAMDADLQDPPEVVEEMLAKWEAGADIVYGVRISREGESLFKRATAAIFYRVIGAMGARHIRADTGDFRLMSRRSLEALKKLPEYHRFIRGMVGWIGFQTAEVHFQRKARKAGETKYTLRKMIHFAIDAVVSFSIMPLRLSYIGAGILSLILLSYILVSAIGYLFYGGSWIPGWASLILAIVAFGTVNLICLGIMGEYVGRIYEQSKGRPVYLVLESSSSRREGSSPDSEASGVAKPSSPDPQPPRIDGGVKIPPD